MTAHKFTDRLTLTFSLGGGEDHEVGVDVKYNFTPGSPEHFDKSLGAWLPADPAEVEVMSLHINQPGLYHHQSISPFMWERLYDDSELLSALESRALDELNRGPDD